MKGPWWGCSAAVHALVSGHCELGGCLASLVTIESNEMGTYSGSLHGIVQAHAAGLQASLCALAILTRFPLPQGTTCRPSAVGWHARLMSPILQVFYRLQLFLRLTCVS